MNLINLDLIETTENIIFKNNTLLFEKEQKINKIMWYPFIINNNNINYLYFREDNNNPCLLETQYIKRFIISNNLELIDNDSYYMNLGIASHNFRFFIFNNIIYGIGGQSLGHHELYINLLLNTNNKIYIDYHNNNIKFIDKYIYGINHLVGSKIYDPNVLCPYFGNGLHLFVFKYIDTVLYNLENKCLPIISGIKEGRHDGHYGSCDNYNIENSRNGLSVFDSNTSVIFNESTQKYYLFQRANIGTGVRYIQYCISDNLIEWSDWSLLKLNPKKEYFETNIYCNNFFKIKDVSNYIGIIQYNKKLSSSYADHDINGFIELYYSNNCENWNLIGNIGTFKYYEDWVVSGEPILLNNKYYFFIHNVINQSINTYSIEKNRFSYAKSIDNKLSTILFKPIYIKNKKIIINFKTYNGFIKMQLLDINKKIIDNYSFDNFDVIYDNINEFNFHVSWNNNINVNIENEVYIELQGIDFELYSIEY